MDQGSPQALFEFAGISVPGRDGAWRIHRVTATIPAAGVTVLLGRSGSGKSTMLRCCNRLEIWTEGTVRFHGVDALELDVLALRRRVAMVFQSPTPFPGTGRDNLHAADPQLEDETAAALLEGVQLHRDVLDRTATELSGGEAQRLCLARSLAVGPEVVLMDEVTSSVDVRATRALEDLARNLADTGTPIVWVTHDLDQARRLADAVVNLDERAGNDGR